MQYIRLKNAFEIVNQILEPGGQWIIADYFNKDDSYKMTGHLWEDFEKEIKASNFNIVYNIDITPNVYPTLAFLQMMGEQLGLPLYEFTKEKLQLKLPYPYYILQEVIGELDLKIMENLEIVNPDSFLEKKKYAFVVLQSCSN